MNDITQDELTSPTERVLALIELFHGHYEGLSPVEIQEQVSISRSTLFSLLKELKDLGYLEQREARGRYFCGPKLKAWSGFQGANDQSLLRAFEDETHKNDYEETIAIAAPAANGLVIIQQVQSKQAIRALYQIGDPLPPGHTALSLMQAVPDGSLTQTGFCINYSSDRYEIGLPICQNGISPDAVLLLNAPAFRWSVDDLMDTWLPNLRSMAARLSYRLGAAAYTPYQAVNQKFDQPKVRLSEKQIEDFLQGPWAARLACIRPDGKPHVIPVWQEWNKRGFTILAWKDSQWAEYVQQNPHVSLTIDEPWQPLRRIVARGEIHPLEGLKEKDQVNLINRLTQRYLGQIATAQFLSQVETIFQFTPQNLSGWMGLTATHS